VGIKKSNKPFLPVPLFLSYAHEDKLLLRKLEVHLSLLKRQGYISTWYDRQIDAGVDWAEAVNKYLAQSAIILLLVSPDFLASDYCYQVEMRHALERHEAGQAQVIPIILRPSDWNGAPFASLQVLPTNGKPVTTWRNVDNAFIDITNGIRRVVEALPLYSNSPSDTTFPLVWNIPYPRNLFFTGHSELLLHLHTQLQHERAMALSQTLAISGLGGIGKTQIAIEYAFRYRQDYRAILWTRADTYEALVSGYVEIAEQLNLRQKDEKDQGFVVKSVLQWLKTQTQWLLILDNADELAIVCEFLPTTYDGHILLTTRAQSMGRLAQRLEVKVMDQDVGALLLLRRAGLVPHNAPLDAASSSDIALAREIAEELDGLPLALDQAGAYIEETLYPLSEYRNLYRTRRSELLSMRRDLIGDHPEPVTTTWSLSFQHVEKKNAVAAELLRFCAYLDSEAIPEELITVGAEYLSSHMQLVANDPLALNKAIATLNAYSLIQRDFNSKMLSVHRLVQAVLRDAIPLEETKQWAMRVIRIIRKIWTSTDFSHWTVCERYLPHVITCATWIEQYNIAFPEAALLLSTAGYYLTRRARYKEAEPLLKLALQVCEKPSGPETNEMAYSLRNLASLYRRLGRYEEAKTLYQRAARIYKQLLGPEHLSTMQCLHSIATVLDTQGKYTEAEILYQQALVVREQQLGQNHQDTAISFNNLGLLYRAQGKYEQAEPLLQRALLIREHLLGTDHPHTAISFNNLAILYQDQKKYEAAELLYQHALLIREKALGPNHPDTATSLNNLAGIYQTQGKYEAAESMYQRALLTQEQVLGTDHPATKITRKNYAALQRVIGQNAEVKKLEDT